MPIDERGYLRCEACAKPVAQVVDGTLRILARHHSKWHLTVFTLAQLEAIVAQMREATGRVRPGCCGCTAIREERQDEN